MQKDKNSIEEIEFQIFRLEEALKQHLKFCDEFGFDGQEKVDLMLEKLSTLYKKRDQLKK